MKAVILCGGEGTRLRPYTYNIPKPMLRLGNRPILEFVLLNLKRYGIRDFILTVGYLHDKIFDYFGDGSKFGVNIEYVIENEKLNTAGSVLGAKNKLTETFFVGMGDHITAINVDEMLAFHKKKNNIATIALKMQGTPVEYGIVGLNDDDTISTFMEKPILSNLINAGIYILEPEIFDYINPKEDFAKHVFPRLLEQGKKISGYKFTEYWADIGRIHDYETMNAIMSVIELSLALKEADSPK
ncbi:MAG: nucleotidyltransferase family protein [Candidatus Micrarchaeia archaeon]